MRRPMSMFENNYGARKLSQKGLNVKKELPIYYVELQKEERHQPEKFHACVQYKGLVKRIYAIDYPIYCCYSL